MHLKFIATSLLIVLLSASAWADSPVSKSSEQAAWERFEQWRQAQKTDATESFSIPVSPSTEKIASRAYQTREERIQRALEKAWQDDNPREEEPTSVPAVNPPSTEALPESAQDLPKPSHPEKPKINIHGAFSTEFAQHIYSPGHVSMIKNQFIANATGAISDSLRYRVSGRVYYNSVYDLYNYYPKNVASDEKSEVELRDTYVDYSTGPWDIRLGKQQIVWGEAIGLFYADVINAKDLREFILPDFDMIRIPEWGMDVEYGKDDFHSEFVFIPAPEFNKKGVRDAEFAPPFPVPANVTSLSSSDAPRPQYGFDNSKLAMRTSYFFHGLDMSAFYLHGWTQSPVMFRTVDSGDYNFTPRYNRLETVGLTFSKDLDNTILKGEFVFNHDGYFSVIDDQDADGVVRSDYVDYLLGVDRTFFEKIDVNLQFMQRAILDYHNSFFNENRFSNLVSLRIDREFLNNKLDTEFMVIAGLWSPNILYRPKVRYNLNDHWQLKIGADIFAGDANTLFGFYRNKSRYYCELTWKF